METVGDPFESLTSCEVGKNVEEKGKKGEEKQDKKDICSCRLFIVILFTWAGASGGRWEGGCLWKEEMRRTGGRGLFFFSLHHDGRGVGGIWTVWMGLFGLRFTPALYSTFKFFCFEVVSWSDSSGRASKKIAVKQ